ncbi:MAG TPA: ABC transporter ATP-binding protein [Actinomycetota bacterium]|nr:ABC transporter ATP-binding protein [Actinomycetota bacterium]
MRLELRGITKRFPGVVANAGVDLTVEEGEIHALLGENGAGKTTLMNILYGLYRADEGEILIDGSPVRFEGPGDAIAAGLGMVHQHFMLIPVFTVTENIVLGHEPTRGRVGFLDRRRARRKVEELSARFRLEVPPDAVVEELPVGVQQRVEILKALYREARIVILDEPTAVLTPQETEELFAVLRSLKASGRSIIFITHKLKEVLAIADRITVLRRGRVVGTTTPAETGEEELAAMMVGRAVQLVVDKPPAEPAGPVLEVRDLVVRDDREQVAVDGVSLEVRAGEIVCVAGVQGNGQTELVEAVTGLRPVAAGTVRILGRDATRAGPRAVLRSGVGHVPEDRQRDGLIATFTIADNLVLNTYDLPPYARWIVRDEEAVVAAAEERVRAFDIRTPSVRLPVSTLSGGNQQKVIVAREFSRPIRVLVASQPTRGLDVGSIEYIHRRIVAARQGGVAVLIVSSELDEVLALADRVAVMYRGRIVDVLPAVRASRDLVGLLMAGARPGAEAAAGG